MSPTSLTLDLASLPAGPLIGQAVDGDFAAARAGDTSAFVRLVRHHQARVFSLALRLTGRREDAEELAQDTFLGLHAQLRNLDSALHVRHWVCRTVTHRSIDLLRARARRPQAQSLDQMMLEVPVEDASGDPLLHRTLRAVLLRLPEIPRAVVVLRFQEDLDPLDIAATLDLPINTVKSHLRRSLDWLRGQGLEMPR
ncbi:MAG TPA: sigma-70 family RNA polymerase sigma factor [Steroidobacteraceae bacterium]|nr:sigma-70 family RNA polymerase sigma factor [Steroidobacteraceae bacterium]